MKRYKIFCFILVAIIALLAIATVQSSQNTTKQNQSLDSSPPDQITKNVALVILNPKDKNGIGVIEKFGWKNPTLLADQYIQTVKEISKNTINYQITETISYNKFPVKKNGFVPNHQIYAQCQISPNQNCRKIINYRSFFDELNLCQKIADNQIHEIWAFGGPWFGFWERITKGPKVNYPKENLPNCGNRTYTIMGFSYERSLSEMLEDLGYRFEDTMPQIPNMLNHWTNFIKSCGSVHVPTNAKKDYDWSNPKSVQSTCDQYLYYPQEKTIKKTISCHEWGCTGLGYKKWWLNHIPKQWWQYTIDPDSFIL